MDLQKLAAVVLVLSTCGIECDIASAQAPILYNQSAYQSLVRADPDDLLLLAGDTLSADDTVVYVKHTGIALPQPPDDIPAGSNVDTGVMPIVSSNGAPYSLTVRMPAAAQLGQTYALWVRSSTGEWSNGILVNDPRPLWITPSTIESTVPFPVVPRQIKIVGRNLQLLPSQGVTVRLIGPETLQIEAVAAQVPTGTAHEYVVTVSLPEQMQPGDYAVQFRRDGGNWLTVPQQSLKVKATSSTPPAAFDISAIEHGGCIADDGLDDTQCLLHAIAAARTANGGIVLLSEGQWDLGNPASPRSATDGETIILPRGVSLRGVDLSWTRLVRHVSHGSNAAPGFVLMGDNVVSGVTFAESQQYRARDVPSAMLQLGPYWERAGQNEPPIENIVITGNVFERPGHGIADGGLPLRSVFITSNLIGAYHVGVRLAGSRFNVAQRFRVDDSVISFNTFIPGSYLDVAAGQGAIASEIGASYRLDFSNNVADGANPEALYPGTAAGWRAGFFWHMNDSHEMLLVADNMAACTGDKAGDGEAIAYDNNANTYAFGGGVSVLAATPTSITLAGALKARQNFRDVDPARFYVGHWLRILQGPGIGQVRRIVAYTADTLQGNVSFEVSPAWDVIPTQSTIANVGREFWQVYTLGNIVDHRPPVCLKSNRSATRGGGLALWGQMSDSVVAHNRQYDSDGIVIHQSHRPDEPGCTDCTGRINAKSFIDVRDNLIDGEYDWSSDCSWSGIQAQYAAAPNVVPPTISFGISISHNEIAKADGWRGGAISAPLTWYAGPPPYRWTLIDNTLIHHNQIRDVTGSAARISCDHASRARVGLKLGGSDLVWRSVTYNNTCTNTATGYSHGGNQTVNDCESPQPGSCECATAAAP